MTIIGQATVGNRIVNIIQNKEPYYGGRYSVEVIFKGDTEPVFQKLGFCYDAAFDFAGGLIRELNRNEREIQSLIS